MTILSLFQWLGHTSVGLAMRHSTWGVAVVEMVHLLALAVLGGTIVLVDLRLFGIGLKRQPAARLAHELSPLFGGSLGILVFSGVLIVSAEPMKCYHSAAFRAKMLLLVIAILFHFTLHRSAVTSATQKISTASSKLAAALSLALWLSVGLAGRAIGFL
ncbi:MAG: DUF6644 family protein [Candidatus Acidiferrales bacterium]|jgi:hypothetical protein